MPALLYAAPFLWPYGLFWVLPGTYRIRPKLVQLENTLTRLREALANNKELVGNLSQEVEPRQDLETKMRAHFEVMQDLQLEDEKQRLATEEEADTGRKRRVQRKKMGFGEND